MKRGLASFLFGVIVGYEGVRLTTHLIYLAIIAGLIATHAGWPIK